MDKKVEASIVYWGSIGGNGKENAKDHGSYKSLFSLRV